MSTPRRRVLRTVPAPVDPQRARRNQKMQAQLAADQAALARWMRKLRRAFHEMERLQTRIRRRERQLAAPDGS